MALSLTHARELPIANARYSVPVSYRDTSGALTNPTSPDSEISVDGGASFTDCAEEVSPTGGHGYLTLSGAEMNNAALIVQCKGTGVLTEVFSIAPAFLPTLATGTATAGGAATITLQVGSSAVDDYYNGCYIRTTGGTGGGGSGGANNQARRIVDYVGSTRVATVAVAWETQPSSDTTYDILVPDGWEQAQSVRTVLALPAVAPDSSGGLPTEDANGRISADATAISGSSTAADNVEANIGNLDASVAGREASGAAAAAVATLNDLSAQEVADAMKLAPTAGDPAAGSVNAHLDTTETRVVLALPAVAPGQNGGLPHVNSQNQVAGVAGNVVGKVLGGGSSTLTGTGVRAVDASGNDVATAANQTTILARLGAWTGSGVNTILGAFKAALSKAASAPSDIGGTFDPAADSVEAIRDRGDAAWTGGGTGLTAQETRDAMKLAPTAGDPAEGSIDALIADIEAGSGLTAQETRDAMKLAPTAGDPAAGSVDAHLADILADTNETQGLLPATTIAAAGDEMDLVDAPNATALTAMAKAFAALDLDQAGIESAATTTLAALLALLDGWHQKDTSQNEARTIGTTTVYNRLGAEWFTVTYPLTTEESYPSGVTPPA